jgi:hypothetical protein
MKKSITYALISWFVVGILLTALTGCTRRELEEGQPSGNVSLTFNWANLKEDEEIPSGMQLYFYSSDGTILAREATASGFNEDLPYGTYQVLAYNTDGINVEQRNLTSYEEAEVYAPAFTRSSSYLYQPSHCYGVGLGTLTVGIGDSCSATMVPQNFIRQAVIKIDANEYADQISSCSGSLGGFVTGTHIANGELIGSSGTLYFDTQKENTAFSTGISFFGKDTEEKNILHLDVDMNDGSTQSLNVDITELLEDVNVVEIESEINVTIEVLNKQAVISIITIKPWDDVNAGGGEVD